MIYLKRNMPQAILSTNSQNCRESSMVTWHPWGSFTRVPIFIEPVVLPELLNKKSNHHRDTINL
jgi:hypothetical protein